MKRVYKGSVAMTWLEEHGDETCIQRFCSAGMTRETLELDCVFEGSVSVAWLVKYSDVLALKRFLLCENRQNH